jgi:hypothetical protein
VVSQLVEEGFAGFAVLQHSVLQIIATLNDSGSLDAIRLRGRLSTGELKGKSG